MVTQSINCIVAHHVHGWLRLINARHKLNYFKRVPGNKEQVAKVGTRSNWREEKNEPAESRSSMIATTDHVTLAEDSCTREELQLLYIPSTTL